MTSKHIPSFGLMPNLWSSVISTSHELLALTVQGVFLLSSMYSLGQDVTPSGLFSYSLAGSGSLQLLISVSSEVLEVKKGRLTLSLTSKARRSVSNINGIDFG